MKTIAAADELIHAATLYISALNHLVEGYRHQDKWERMDALRDSVNITREKWHTIANRLKGVTDD